MEEAFAGGRLKSPAEESTEDAAAAVDSAKAAAAAAEPEFRRRRRNRGFAAARFKTSLPNRDCVHDDETGGL